MHRYETSQGTISVDSDDYNRIGDLTYQGSQSSSDQLKARVYKSYGPFGHMIKNACSPIDLEFVLSQLGIPFERTEGSGGEYAFPTVEGTFT